MPHDPMKTLLRVRLRAVEEGRRTLAASLDAAAAASEAVRGAELAIFRETQRASEPSGSDSLVEAYAAWLPGARRRVAQALALQDRHEAEVARCRADLTACRSALESIQTLCDRRAAAVADALARREAQELDETGSRPGPDDG